MIAFSIDYGHVQLINGIDQLINGIARLIHGHYSTNSWLGGPTAAPGLLSSPRSTHPPPQGGEGGWGNGWVRGVGGPGAQPGPPDIN